MYVPVESHELTEMLKEGNVVTVKVGSELYSICQFHIRNLIGCKSKYAF